jgi:hypothetical protein
LNVVPAGMTSMTVTAPAGAGPALLTTIVYVIGRPVPYGGADGVFVIERSTAPPETVVDAFAELFPGVAPRRARTRESAKGVLRRASGA